MLQVTLDRLRLARLPRRTSVTAAAKIHGVAGSGIKVSASLQYTTGT